MAPHNTRLETLLKGAFPMESSKAPKIFFKLKSSDPEKLDLAISNFLTNLIVNIQELPQFEFLKDDLINAHINVGHIGNNTVIMLPMDKSELSSNVGMMMQHMSEQIKQLELQISMAFSTATTLKEILEHVLVWSYDRLDESHQEMLMQPRK